MRTAQWVGHVAGMGRTKEYVQTLGGEIPWRSLGGRLEGE
jgi:hypothetical protein